MPTSKNVRVTTCVAIFFLAVSFSVAKAQDTATVLNEKDSARVVPTSFYFEGQSAPTQMRNSAAARFGPKRYVIAGLVDTSGYSSGVREKYQGFLITDSPIAIGGKQLGIGAYGFGFTDDAKFNVFDVGGNLVLSTSAAKDATKKRPRPLMMEIEGGELRLYAGRNYTVITAK